MIDGQVRQFGGLVYPAVSSIYTVQVFPSCPVFPVLNIKQDCSECCKPLREAKRETYTHALGSDSMATTTVCGACRPCAGWQQPVSIPRRPQPRVVVRAVPSGATTKATSINVKSKEATSAKSGAWLWSSGWLVFRA